MSEPRPIVALTLGDVAGVGPELVLRAWAESPLLDLAAPFVVGDHRLLERVRTAVGQTGSVRIVPIERPEEARADPQTIPCLDATNQPLDTIQPGVIDARAGRAAYDFLVTSIDLALAGRVDAIVTLPLQKEALHAAGIRHPGHTEILAERCGVPEHAMMLYLPPKEGDPTSAGLGVIHVTLHVALRSVFDLITVENVFSKIRLADESMGPLTSPLGRRPRIAVAGLNPHAGENGLFGDEEQNIIGPAVEIARRAGIDASGPVAADTLFSRAIDGEFDAVVAQYHDQGHVALKTVGFDRAVNVTLGLPIVRTSVAHGTAFDIAWQGKASPASLIQATKVAARLVSGRRLTHS